LGAKSGGETDALSAPPVRKADIVAIPAIAANRNMRSLLKRQRPIQVAEDVQSADPAQQS
jgi:hypothetical protein